MNSYKKILIKFILFCSSVFIFPIAHGQIEPTKLLDPSCVPARYSESNSTEGGENNNNCQIDVDDINPNTTNNINSFIKQYIPIIEAERRTFFRPTEWPFGENSINWQSQATTLNTALEALENVPVIYEWERKITIQSEKILEAFGNSEGESLFTNLLSDYQNNINGQKWGLEKPFYTNENKDYHIPETEDRNGNRSIYLTGSTTSGDDWGQIVFPLGENIYPIYDDPTDTTNPQKATTETFSLMTDTFKDMVRMNDTGYTCASWDGGKYGSECAVNPYTGLVADRHLQENFIHPYYADLLRIPESNSWNQVQTNTGCINLSDTDPSIDAALNGRPFNRQVNPWEKYIWGGKFLGVGPGSIRSRVEEQGTNLHCYGMKIALKLMGTTNPSWQKPTQNFMHNLMDWYEESQGPLENHANIALANIKGILKGDSNHPFLTDIDGYERFKENGLTLFTRHLSWGHFSGATMAGWPLPNSTNLLTNPTNNTFGRGLKWKHPATNEEVNIYSAWTFSTAAQYCHAKGGRLPTVAEAWYFAASGRWKLTPEEELWVEPPWSSKSHYFILTGDIQDLYENQEFYSLWGYGIRIPYENGKYNYNIGRENIKQLDFRHVTNDNDEIYLRTVWYCVYD